MGFIAKIMRTSRTKDMAFDILALELGEGLYINRTSKIKSKKRESRQPGVCIVCIPWRKVNSSLGTCHVCNNIFVKYSFDYGTVALGARNICMI